MKINSISSILSRVSAVPSDILKRLDKVGGFQEARFEKGMSLIAGQLAPMIKQALGRAYAQSGLRHDTGTLYEASVTGVSVRGDIRGIEVAMKPGVHYKAGPGKKNRTANVYGSAGAKKYGGIRVAKPGYGRLTGTTRKIAIRGNIQSKLITMRPFKDFFSLNLESGVIAEAYAARVKQLLIANGIEVV